MVRMKAAGAVTAAVLLALASAGGALGLVSATAPAVPTATCGPGSSPETGLQGQVSAADVNSGRAAQGYRCNTELVGSELSSVPLGSFGGFKVLRYIDPAGHECAFYDVQLLVGTGIADVSQGVNAGVAVLDMSDPTHPKRTATLSSVAMISPHESVVLSPNRGLLAAVMGTPAFAPGVVDVYDIAQDCRHPVLKSLPNIAGVVGHESGMAPDGRTFYSGNPAPGGQVAAVDITDPSNPRTLATIAHPSHGISISDDGNTAYLTSLFPATITIMDVSQINARVPNPQVRVIGSVTWPGTIPQIALPVTIGGHPYLVEVDEYGALGNEQALNGSTEPGAARIIDIADPTRPAVISNIRLQVHDPANFAALQGDPGAAQAVGGYAGHYCNVPQRTDPGLVACSMLSSGLRMFDIRDPYHPKEVAYFNQPAALTPPSTQYGVPSSWAQSSPAFAPDRCEVWYSDGRTGFYDVRLTNGVCSILTKPSSTGGGSSSPAAPATPGAGTAPRPAAVGGGANASSAAADPAASISATAARLPRSVNGGLSGDKGTDWILVSWLLASGVALVGAGIVVRRRRA